MSFKLLSTEMDLAKFCETQSWPETAAKRTFRAPRDLFPPRSEAKINAFEPNRALKQSLDSSAPAPEAASRARLRWAHPPPSSSPPRHRGIAASAPAVSCRQRSKKLRNANRFKLGAAKSPRKKPLGTSKSFKIPQKNVMKRHGKPSCRPLGARRRAQPAAPFAATAS